MRLKLWEWNRIINSGLMNRPIFRCFGEGDRRKLAVGLSAFGWTKLSDLAFRAIAGAYKNDR